MHRHLATCRERRSASISIEQRATRRGGEEGRVQGRTGEEKGRAGEGRGEELQRAGVVGFNLHGAFSDRHSVEREERGEEREQERGGKGEGGGRAGERREEI